MKEPRDVPFARPWINDQDRQAVADVLAGHILAHGPQATDFENEFAAFLGHDAQCVSVSSCMAALHLAYLQLGIGPGDEVLVPALTHVATAHAVELVGAKPVFVDCEPDTGNIDVGKAESLVTRNTRVFSLVHFAGIPCTMDAVMEVAQRQGLRVVEDCALAVGGRYRDRHVGLFGDAATFSFYPVKHITTAEGGMFVTRHPQVAEQVRRIRAFGLDRSHMQRSRPGIYQVTELGLNYRMSEVHAALGRGQLKRIEENLRRRCENFTILKQALGRLEDVRVIDASDQRVQNSYYCLSAVLRGRLRDQRDELVSRLRQAGVGTSVYYPQPVPRMPYYRDKYGYQAQACPNAEEISDRSVALPVGPHMSRQDAEYVAHKFSETLKELRA